jgi:hypothetical protein
MFHLIRTVQWRPAAGGTLQDHTLTAQGNYDESALQRRVAEAVEAIARGVGRR